jgi:hypothetical protein
MWTFFVREMRSSFYFAFHVFPERPSNIPTKTKNEGRIAFPSLGDNE